MTKADESLIEVGGKTSTGNNRYEVYNPATRSKSQIVEVGILVKTYRRLTHEQV